ncbi:V-type ATP synthase subunit I [Peptoniphilus sp. MSJ-1]|uniref:V-type ATP synthase subunit I n=1 Tax=Peptoniphilus ovalis TaxID=2841503 RepID=A0ABS6FL17_9FIRM|nr:V-type ATP synthase subunit I [Peptoniphilus ovalis]MBU5670153.1 V-type ATP synthase subunit I [Peptoniphilus ovalis]
MAIVNMSKFNLFTFDNDRKKILDRFQKFEYVHIVESKSEDEDLNEIKSSDELVHIDSVIKRAKDDIELLEAFEEKKSSLQSLKEGNENLTLEELRERALDFNFEKIDGEIKAILEKKEKLKNKIQNIDAKIQELNPWKSLDSPISDLDNLEFVLTRTGMIPNRYAPDFEKALDEFDLTYEEKLSQDKNYSYYLVVYDDSLENDVDEIFKTSGFTPINIKTKNVVSDEIDSLKSQKEKIISEIKATEESLKDYVKYTQGFKVTHDYYSNEKIKILSQDKFLKTNSVDLIEGYVPFDRIKDFENEIEKVVGDNYYIQVKEADRDSPEVPIMLKNNSFVRPFEMMTEMYAMPKYNEIDPTPFFAPFYFIFAGIMVGDFGYGLLVFLGTLIALKSFNLSDSKKRFIKFFNYLSISTMIFGLIFGSFFGGAIEIPGIIDPAEDSTILVMISLIIGGIHIFFALGIKAYMDIRDGKPKDALFDVGFWYMALIGIIGLLLQMAIDSLSPFKNIFLGVMIIGMIGIVLTGGRDEKSTAGKIGWGIYSLYGITSYLGDFVSYLRLMALVLSGSFLGLAINIISGMLFGSGIFGKVGAIIIFVVFQLFNAFLSYLSAYVHTARLTYVEMFNKFYEGGGVPFRKMIEESDYFNIENN